MAVTPKWQPLGLLEVLKAPYDLEAVTLKMALVTDAYTPAFDTHDFWNDISASEVANGNGYTTGGVTLTSVALSYDAASDQIRLDFADPSWTFTASVTWRYAAIYIDTAGASSTDPVVALLTWDSNQSVSTAYTLTIDAAGLLYIDCT